MAVRIRLKRTGARNSPCYRIVVADQRAARDGRAIEEIGFYDPVHYDEKIDLERAEYWVGQGAQPSETVMGIMKRFKAGTNKKPEQKAAIEAKKAAELEKKRAEEAKKKAEEAKKAAEAEAAAKAAEEAAASEEATEEQPAEANAE